MDVVEHQAIKNQQIEVSYLVVGILGIIGGVILVASLFHCMMFCLRNNGSQTTSRGTTIMLPASQRQAQQPQSCSNNNKSKTGQASSIMSSTYANSDNKEEELVEVCGVCLGEFEEGEGMRILPQCGHMYHVLCIDKWLASHSSCPLCRANIVV